MLRGRVGSVLEIESKDIKSTHIKELKTFTVLVNGKVLGKAYYFSGRGDYYPWLEIDYDIWLRKDGLEVDFFSFIYHFLPPGGKLFVTYLKDPDTRKMLLQGYNPADTPLGFSLLKAGFTWFKDWYFPEGGNEGVPKLQTNKAFNELDELRELKDLLNEVKREEVRRYIEERIAKGKS
ncbi:DUF1122 family protein [Stygiolobus caldivivus]|uniref:DUF1122 domain-containing protein n=1 Tax=Stygiolobus caldivivus TaxID=2824673 RepID=A0A8D5ZDN7_9CREN|nr:DUF1122 family protein [Stygiolobus caldivivus]BCU69208.1 hypothetical protein KN1_05050 [Stygiolobus caldivivus]